MALGSHLITVRRLKKYIDDVIGKKANLPDTSKTIIGNISQINSDLTNNTCTNLLNPTAQTQTVSGVTFTNNGDGTYTVNGTASGTIEFILMTFNDFALLENKKLIGSPAGGSLSSYMLYITCVGDSTWLTEYNDYGNGAIVSNIPSKATDVTLRILVRPGQTVNNLLFKPMLTTDLNATYDDYVPYTGDSGRLNEDVSNKQNKTDNALTTTSKQIVGAINEINSDLTGLSNKFIANINQVIFTAESTSTNITFNVNNTDIVVWKMDWGSEVIQLLISHDSGKTWSTVFSK